jgi:very-short-patch-repair endonuclease
VVPGGTVSAVDSMLRSLLDTGDGLITSAECRRSLPRWAIDNARRAGRVRRVLPGVYLDASRCDDPALCRRAALAYAGERAALSHTSALTLWGLRGLPESSTPGEPTHVTVPRSERVRSRPGVVVHRSGDFLPEPPHRRFRSGQPVVSLERALVGAWPLLPVEVRRGPVIQAVNDRLTTPDRIAQALARAPKLPGRAALGTLLDRLAAGCRSTLEIWGYDHVFTAPGMPRFKWQQRVQVDGRTYYLDVLAEAEQVNFELDGAASHSRPDQREADVRRDALLATIGILVVRFAHRRLIHEPAEVRREILAILNSRQHLAHDRGAPTR